MSGLQPDTPSEDPKASSSPQGPEVNIWDGISTESLFLSHDDLALICLEERCRKAKGSMLEEPEREMILRNFARAIPYSGEFNYNDHQSELSYQELFGRNVLRKLAQSFAEDGPLIDSGSSLEFHVVGGFLVNSDTQKVHLGVRFKDAADQFVMPFDLDQSFASKTFQGFELELDLSKPDQAYQRAVYWMSRSAFEDQVRAFRQKAGILHWFAVSEFKKHLEGQDGFEGFIPEIPTQTTSLTQVPPEKACRVSFKIGEEDQAIGFTYTHTEAAWALTFKVHTKE